MNIPNILTMFRLFLIPVFILIFFSGIGNSLILAVAIFLVAGFTDVLDGYIARKFNMITKWGIVLDPLTDKLMLLTVLSCLVIEGYTPLWILLVIGAKEIFMIICGTLLYRQDWVIPSNIFGKVSTLLFYLSILIISLGFRYGNYLLYVAVFSAVVAFVNYLVIYLKSKGLQPNGIE